MRKRIFRSVLMAIGSVMALTLIVIAVLLYNNLFGLRIGSGTFYNITGLLIIALLIAVVFSVILAYIIAKRITEPLDKIDPDYPLEKSFYPELTPILKRLHSQNKSVGNKTEELKQDQKQFIFITENMREGVILLDNNKHILSINRAAINFIDTTTDCIGENFENIEQSEKINTAVDRAFGNGHCQIRCRKKDYECQFDVSRIENNGHTMGAVILIVDITEQVDAERMRREFSANVSHELKTPLQTIMGSAELMENGLVKEDDMPRFIGHIKKESQRLVSLVEDIIRLSQLDEGGQLQKDNVSLNDMVKEVFELLENSANQKNITLDIQGDNVSIYGVRQLLFEILYNLCDNAVKYNHDNGNVTVTLSENLNETIVSVSDTGIGIPSEHQSRIFERFYRVDKSHSRKSGGTGLGLSIVKHAVSYHDGVISVNSSENNGTEITIKFNKKS